MYTDVIKRNFAEHLQTIESAQEASMGFIEKASSLISQSLANGGTIMWCGNGGSASDSQHLAAELVGRFKADRRPLRSMSLNADTSVLTCVANDFGYDDIFSRQIAALARPKDVLVTISTSGNSENIVRAINQANELDVTTIALLGKGGGAAKDLADHAYIVPSDSTARIQEMHILIGHILCELIEAELGLS